MDIINHQTLLIKQMFINLDMPDVVNYFENRTPFGLSNNRFETPPYDIVLQEPCTYGLKCLYKKTPLLCSKNHQTNKLMIKKDELIPKYLCKYERPWRLLNDKPMRCKNKYCWFSHLEGRNDNINI
jgi:hypothetical protein